MSFLVSVILEAARVVSIQALVGRLQYNAVEALVYLSPAIAAVLVAGSLAWERAGLLGPSGGLAKVQHNPLPYLLAAFMGGSAGVQVLRMCAAAADSMPRNSRTLLLLSACDDPVIAAPRQQPLLYAASCQSIHI